MLKFAIMLTWAISVTCMLGAGTCHVGICNMHVETQHLFLMLGGVATYNSSRLQAHGFGLGIVMGHDLKSVRCVLALESAFFRPRGPPTEVPPTACFDVCRLRHLGSMHGMFVATRQCADTAQYTNAFSSGFVATITAYMAQIPGVSDRMTRQNDMSSSWGLGPVEHSTYKLLLQGIRKIDLSSIMQELRRNIETNDLILRECVSQNTVWKNSRQCVAHFPR